MNVNQIEHLPLFQDVDSALLSKFVQCSHIKHYKKGQLIFLHDNLVEYFYVILSGWVQLFRDTLDGQEAFIGLATFNDFMGGFDFDRQVHLFSAKAIDESEVILLPYVMLKEIIKSNGSLAIKIIQALNSTKSLLELQLEHNSTMIAAQRVGCFILRLLNKKRPNLIINIPCDKMLIAAYLGMKRETFSRALNDLKAIGVTVNGHSISVDNIENLIKFTCVSCSLIYDTCKN